MELKETAEPMGFCGISPAICQASSRKARSRSAGGSRPANWGHGYITEAAEGLLDYGFRTIGLGWIVSFAVEENQRSTAVMQRIGMIRRPDLDFNHPRVPDTHPHLQRHVSYAITKEQYLERGRVPREVVT